MSQFKQLTQSDLEARKIESAEEFPGSHFGCLLDIRPSTMIALRVALADGSEEKIQEFLTANPYLIQYAVDHSGHHGVWVFPKPMIKPRGMDKSPGLIPDYLIVTRSSLGYGWHVVELKRFNVQFARRNGRGPSQDGNEAIVQCNAYLSHFQDYVDAVRSNLRIDELVQPRGAIVLIGNSETENDEQLNCRANFVRGTPRIQVVTYNRIVRSLESDLGLRS
jgi:Shedu protein SduA, C-terminal